MKPRKPYVRAWQRASKAAWVAELQAQGLSLREACKRAGVSRSSVWRWAKRGGAR